LKKKHCHNTVKNDAGVADSISIQGDMANEVRERGREMEREGERWREGEIERERERER